MITSRNESVLLYLVNNSEREKKLKNICLMLGIRMKFASEEMQLKKVGYLLSLPNYSEEEEVGDFISFTEDILVMNGFTRERMNEFLTALKKEKIFVPLKAVVTDHNINWSFKDLYEELKKEHQVMMERKTEA